MEGAAALAPMEICDEAQPSVGGATILSCTLGPAVGLNSLFDLRLSGPTKNHSLWGVFHPSNWLKSFIPNYAFWPLLG